MGAFAYRESGDQLVCLGAVAVGTLDVGGTAEHNFLKDRFAVSAAVLEDRHGAIIHK